jgi:hypothetical protein
VKKVGSLCGPFIRELGIQDAVRFAAVKRDWDTIFSQPLSEHMSPCTLSHGEILLNVDSPVWLQELQYYKKEILGKLRAYGITSMRFKIGRVSRAISRKKRDKELKSKPLTPEEISLVEETAAHVDDKELRETLQRAMKRSLSSQKAKHKRPL